MTIDLPIEVHFTLPGPQWVSIDPDSAGVSDAAFLAMRQETPGDYTPLLSLGGALRLDPSTMTEIADESLALLARQGTDVELVHRRVTESEHAPAVSQMLGATVTVEGRTYDVRQVQALQGVVDVRWPGRRVVLIHTLTCTYAQHRDLLPEFAAYLESVQIGDQTPA